MPARSRWSLQGEGSRFYTTLAKNTRRPMLPGMRDVAFFAAFAIYAWAGIDTRLIYHWQGPVFTTMPGFLGEFLKYPGGPAERGAFRATTSIHWRATRSPSPCTRRTAWAMRCSASRKRV